MVCHCRSRPVDATVVVVVARGRFSWMNCGSRRAAGVTAGDFAGPDGPVANGGLGGDPFVFVACRRGGDGSATETGKGRT
jgi:hypothetical protein